MPRTCSAPFVVVAVMASVAACAAMGAAVASYILHRLARR